MIRPTAASRTSAPPTALGRRLLLVLAAALAASCNVACGKFLGLEPGLLEPVAASDSDAGREDAREAAAIESFDGADAQSADDADGADADSNPEVWAHSWKPLGGGDCFRAIAAGGSAEDAWGILC